MPLPGTNQGERPPDEKGPGKASREAEDTLDRIDALRLRRTKHFKATMPRKAVPRTFSMTAQDEANAEEVARRHGLPPLKGCRGLTAIMRTALAVAVSDNTVYEEYRQERKQLEAFHVAEMASRRQEIAKLQQRVVELEAERNGVDPPATLGGGSPKDSGMETDPGTNKEIEDR